MYTEKATFSELLELESVQNFMEEAAPGMIGSPAMEYMKGMTVEQLLLNMPEKKRGMFCMLLDVQTGKKWSLRQRIRGLSSRKLKQTGNSPMILTMWTEACICWIINSPAAW